MENYDINVKRKKHSKRHRIFMIIIFLSFLVCCLEWGGNNSGFIFEMELAVFTQSGTDHFLHPFVILPLIGQIIVLSGIITNKLPVWTISAGIILLSTLVLMILLVGLISINLRIIASTLPFVITSILYFVNSRKRKRITAI